MSLPSRPLSAHFQLARSLITLIIPSRPRCRFLLFILSKNWKKTKVHRRCSRGGSTFSRVNTRSSPSRVAGMQKANTHTHTHSVPAPRLIAQTITTAKRSYIFNYKRNVKKMNERKNAANQVLLLIAGRSCTRVRDYIEARTGRPLHARKQCDTLCALSRQPTDAGAEEALF